MRTTMFIFLIGVTWNLQSQTLEVKRKATFFSLSPIHSKVEQVNGLVMGVGHYDNKKIKRQMINGLNIDVIHPAPLLFLSFGLDIPFQSALLGITYDGSTGIHLVDDIGTDQSWLTMNGLNLSVGGFYSGTNFNGLNISLFAALNKMNGLSMSPVFNAAGISNGLQLSVLSNYTYKGNGLQLAVSNVADQFHGVQIGLFNNSSNQRGVQIGLWNKNEKRSLPFINWQFKG